MFESLQVYDDGEARPAALNMAIDEALMSAATRPILRYYRWAQPSLSFGYFGCYADVANQSPQREIVRRWTGGGIVLHGEDLTYSVIIPRAHSFFAQSSLEIYRAIHEAIQRALEMNRIDAELVEQAAPKLSEECFANPVRADVVSDGQKIAGAAHRRTRSGLLHQGSIQRAHLPERFRADLAHALCREYESAMVAPEWVKRAAEIAARKYGTEEWLKRR